MREWVNLRRCVNLRGCKDERVCYLQVVRVHEKWRGGDLGSENV